MATPNFAKKNPFMGMTVAQMKAYYDKKVRGKKLSAAELKSMANQMQAAKKAAPKAKPAASKPRQTTRKEAEARFYSSSSQGSIAKNQEKAKSNFFRSSSGTRGPNMPSQPKLKGKPKRSDFPAGRGGQASYAAALRRYNKPATAKKTTPSSQRRGRLSTTDRRRARRSSR